MERERQLTNVAFGGDWSDLVLVRERLQGALAVLEAAVEDSAEQDAGRPEVLAAVHLLTERIARGELMAESWAKAAKIFDQGERARQLGLVLDRIRSGSGRAALTPSTDVR